MEAARLLALGKLRFPSEEEKPPEQEVDEALAAFGLVADAPVIRDELFYLWPECLEAFRFWRGIQTQWHRDMENRRVRLDFQAVDLVMKWEGIPKKQQKELTGYIRAMEVAALNAQVEQG